jgi:amino acid adenylation domain-containing protein/non-ribosomal peptide synthase protein (TIGR01720 family)
MLDTVIEGYRLSPQQKHLWRLQQLDGSPAYHCRCAVVIKGALDTVSLRFAIANVVERFEILRTSFSSLQGMDIPLQVVQAAGDLLIPEHDLRGLESADQETRPRSLLEGTGYTSFDPRCALQSSLIILPSREHLLLLAMSALCGDRAAMVDLVKEIRNSYLGCLSGGIPDGDPVQYADVAEVLADLAESQETEAGRRYWSSQNFLEALGLKAPFENESPAAEFNPQSLSAAIGLDTVGKIQAAASEYGVSPRVFALACWGILMHRLTEAASVVIGVEYPGRSQNGLEGAIGLFSRQLPVVCNLEDDPEFDRLLVRLQESTSEIDDWQDYFSWDALAPSQSEPFFPICFEFWHECEAAMSDGAFSITDLYACTDRFKLKLSCSLGDDALAANLVFDPRLFRVEDMIRLAEQFRTLVKSAADHPLLRVTRLDVVGDRERRQVLVEFNQTGRLYPQAPCLDELFEGQVVETRDSIALVCGESRLSYTCLNARANRLARHLEGLGVRLGSRVAICVERSPEMIVAVLAVLKAGAAYVPLDPAYPFDRLAYVLQDSSCSVLLTQQRFRGKLPEENLLVVCVDTEFNANAVAMADSPGRRSASDAVAYVIYTSGSTGKPKGVMITHRAICNHMLWIGTTHRFDESDKLLQRAPFSFDASVWEVFAPLLTGAQLVLAGADQDRDPATLVRLMIENEITVMQFVPSLLWLLLETQDLAAVKSLKRVFSGGEALPLGLAESFFERRGGDLHNLYGPTEASINATSWTCRKGRGDRVVPIGHPISNTQIYLLDLHLEPVPIGVPGMLHIGGNGLARGYLDRPDLTAEKFLPNQFSPLAGERLYVSGDLARYGSDGSIVFIGRLDQQTKIRGFRVELAEIESAMTAHPAVESTVVISRDEEPGGKRLIAYVVLKAGLGATESELRRFVKEQLPEYMTPSGVAIIDTVPRMPNGKLDRGALARISVGRSSAAKPYSGPVTEVEKRLCRIWEQVLGLDRVDIHDNFFDLGGDSILAIRMAARANQEGLQITPRQLFQNQTIAQLVGVATVAGHTPAKREAATGEVPLTPIQRRFSETVVNDPHHFNQAVLLEVRRHLDPPALERALQHLVDRHAAFALRFTRQGAAWRQMSTVGGAKVPFEHVDLSSLPEAQRAAALESSAAAMQASLNLTDGPLIRTALYNLGPHLGSRLLIVIHHMAVDIISWSVLLEDLHTIYEQATGNQSLRLAPNTSSFSHWAEKLSEYAQSPALRRELPYWLSETRRTVSGIPVDYFGGENTEASACTVSVSLDADETRALLREVPKAYHTQIHEVLLTAQARAFRWWTGTGTMLVDIEGHGREEIFDDIDLSRTVGWFTSVFPLLLDIEGADEPGESLKAVKEQIRRIPNGGIGYGLLRYMTGDACIGKSLQELPQAEVIFNHMGQFDQVVGASAPFGPAPESSGPAHSPRALRGHLLEINGGVLDGRLRSNWTFSENTHNRWTIEEVARRFLGELRLIISHCLSPDAYCYTPSDFPHAHLDQYSLSRVLETVKFGE